MSCPRLKDGTHLATPPTVTQAVSSTTRSSINGQKSVACRAAALGAAMHHDLCPFTYEETILPESIRRLGRGVNDINWVT